MTSDTSTKAAALYLLARGLATQSEAAKLAGVSRQVVRFWAQQAGVDCAKKRARALAAAWREACRASK
jgi:hypothetical protein